jgi:5'-3' exonuclease
MIGAWAQTEEPDIEHSFVKKYKMRLPPPKGYAEQCLLPIQNMAIDLAEEARMWSRGTGQLLPEWKGGYYREKRGRCLTNPEIGERCAEYLRGLQWNIDYYTGQRPVSSSWMYAWTYSPLWSDIRQYLERTREMPLAPEVIPLALKPQEQLALVLPRNSWWLIRDPALRIIPTKIPHFWPDHLTFSAVGKRWLWECIPEIPILTPARLRVVLQQGTVA